MAHSTDCKYCKLKEELEITEGYRDRCTGAESEAYDAQAEEIAAELETMEPCERWSDARE